MYDILLILLLILIFCNKGNLESFTNGYLIDDYGEICKENSEKIKLIEEKLELESLKPRLIDGKHSQFTQEYTIEINKINEKINDINKKIQDIELKENKNSNNNYSIYGNKNNNIYVNKFINILIIISIAVLTYYSLYYLGIFIIKKLKIKGIEIEELDVKYDNIMDFLKKQKLKKKYKINT